MMANLPVPEGSKQRKYGSRIFLSERGSRSRSADGSVKLLQKPSSETYEDTSSQGFEMLLQWIKNGKGHPIVPAGEGRSRCSTG